MIKIKQVKKQINFFILIWTLSFRIDIQKPKIISHRFGQTFLLDNIKNEELNQSEDTENLRPKISDEIPFMIHCDPTLLPENESHHSEIVEHP